MTAALSNELWEWLLMAAKEEERLALTQIVTPEATKGLSPKELRRTLSLCAGHGVMNWARGGEGVAYAEILSDACDHLDVPEKVSVSASQSGGFSINAMDHGRTVGGVVMAEAKRRPAVFKYVKDHQTRLLAKLAVDIYNGMTAEQRRKLDAEVEKLAKDNGLSGVAKSAAVLALANAGGFATYALMSTILSAISFGTLSFGAYTLASSLLSVVLGPIGWAALGVVLVQRLGAPDASKVVRIAATTALISARLGSSSAWKQ